jgi:hypothetical protein
MRTTMIVFLLLTLSLAVFGVEEETPSQLAARAAASPLDQQPDLYLKAAAHQLKTADDLYSQGKTDEAGQDVQLVSQYADKASDASIRSGKKLKNAEIEIRKMAARLRDIQRTLSFDDQTPVKAAIDHLEDLRTQLLAKMFAKEKKK